MDTIIFAIFLINFSFSLLCGKDPYSRAPPAFDADECQTLCSVDAHQSQREYVGVAIGPKFFRFGSNSNLNHKRDCLCLMGCSCFIVDPETLYETTLTIDPPVEQCDPPREQSFSLNTCSWNSDDTWEDDDWISYECIANHRRVTREIFATHEDCHAREHIQRSKDFPFGQCFEEFPGRFIKITTCDESNVYFSECHTRPPTFAPSPAPTVSFPSKPPTAGPSFFPSEFRNTTFIGREYPDKSSADDEAGGFEFNTMHWILLACCTVVLIALIFCCIRSNRKRFSMDDYLMDDDPRYPRIHLDSQTETMNYSDSEGLYTPRTFGDRQSDFHLMRDDSVEKWTPREIKRHEWNVQHEIASLAQQTIRHEEKKKTMDDMHTLCIE